MNALRIRPLLCIAICAAMPQAQGHEPAGPPSAPAATHEPAARTPVPRPVAPSAVPQEAYYFHPYAHAQGYGRFDDVEFWPISSTGCIAKQARGDADTQATDAAQTIDWCALPPQRPRYAPQVPAAWWWHRGARWWRHGNTR